MEDLAQNMMNDIIVNATKSLPNSGGKDNDAIDNDTAVDQQYVSALKRQYDLLLQDLQDRLGHEEDAHSALTSQKKKLEQELAQQKKEIEDLELSLQKVSQLADRLSC